MAATSRPRVAVVDDYEIVIAGLDSILQPYADRIQLVPGFRVDEPLHDPVDLALYDTVGRQGLEEVQLARILCRPDVGRVAVYTFNPDDESVRHALAAGATGCLSKATPAKELVDQLELLARGDEPVRGPNGSDPSPSDDRSWPGRDLGLSEREAEVVALAALGRRNADIADALFVSIDTVKTHLARSFRKLGVHNRTELSALIHRRRTFARMVPDAD